MRILATFVITFLSYKISYCQQPTSNENNMTSLLQEVFYKVKNNSVFRKDINWQELEHFILDSTCSNISESDFKNKIKLLFTKIGDKHGAFYYKGERLGMDQSWKNKLRIPDNIPNDITLKTTFLEEGYGYILIPPNNSFDAETCQRYQDSLCNLGLENLKGLIIDLRLNQGGSVYPLFGGLNQVYGAKYFGSNITLDRKVLQKWTVSNGAFGRNRILNRCKANPKLKIVVLISQITASAGEMMAVALKGRSNTLFIGESTCGLTTMNVNFKIGVNTLSIASSIIADRKGNVYLGSVPPDITITNGDNFYELFQDTKVIAALEWMKHSN